MPHASEPAAELQCLHDTLAHALQASDWTAVAECDHAIRQCLLRLGDGPLEAPAVAAKQRLHRLHSEALHACAQECERLRQRLEHHLDYAEGRSAYQRIGLMGGR